MWKQSCNQLIDSKKFENEFVAFYGEKHRNEIKAKLNNCTFIFVPTNLDGFLNLKLAFEMGKVFNSTIQPFEVNEYYNLLDAFNHNPINLIYYENLITNIGYDINNIIQIKNNDLKQGFIKGCHYNKLTSQLTQLQLLFNKFSINEYDAYQNLNNPVTQLVNTPTNINSSITSLVKDTNSFHMLITSFYSFEEWETSQFPNIYIKMFNSCFNTKFNSFEDLKNNKFYYNIMLSINNLRKKYLTNLDELNKSSNNVNLSYIDNENNISQEHKDGITKQIKSVKNSSDWSGFCYNYIEDVKNPSLNDVKHNIVIKLDENTSYSTILHELTHIIHTDIVSFKPKKEIAGFQTSKKEEVFNEVITDFLAKQMVDTFYPQNKKFPILQNSSSAYRTLFKPIKKFLLQYKDLLKECQFAPNAPQMLINVIGEDNYDQLISLISTYYKLKPSHCINYISQHTDGVYNSLDKILEPNNFDTLQHKFKHNIKVKKFLNTAKSLYDLNNELTQHHTSNLKPN